MSGWEWDKDYKPKQMPKSMTAEEVVDALGNRTREVPHIDSTSDAEWHILRVADGQEICRVPQLRGDLDSEPVMCDIAHAIANAGPCLSAARADAKRLREALNALAESPIPAADGQRDTWWQNRLYRVQELARAALQPATESKEARDAK